MIRCPSLGLASERAKKFTTLFKHRRGEDLATWIERAIAEAVKETRTIDSQAGD
jgi:hypothetical protein